MREKTLNKPNKTVNRTSRFFSYTRLIIFIVLLVICLLIFFSNINERFMDFPVFLPLGVVELVFLVSCCVRTFFLKEFYKKIVCFCIEIPAIAIMTLLAKDSYLSILYILVLSDYYFTAPSFSVNIALASVSLVLFIGTVVLKTLNVNAEINIMSVITSYFNEIIVFIVHFIFVVFALNVFDTKQKLTDSLKQLDESNQKLQKAYDELEEVTALKERQRIAGEIHDTAGHSITTVIMQTEAAKLIVDNDPEGAKRKIIAANLQAKNALEELRECVHLLAGSSTPTSLKEELEKIIHNSCDGTNVVIRYDIEDLQVLPSKRRFLCNCLKEGISNGIRHGGATAFYFELSLIGGNINFLLSDNGQGVDVAKLKQGFGLTNMRSRVVNFGGRIDFSSFPDEGFEVHIQVPIDRSTMGKKEEQ